jgi:stathmin
VFDGQNAKLTEIRASIDTRDIKKSTEQTRIIENKLSTAEMNREKELQKKLDKIQEHVRMLYLIPKIL